MQAEIPPTLKRSSASEQTAPAVMCPLCSTLLMIREIPPQQTIVMCPACGYSAPYIQRQHLVSDVSSVQRQPVGSSVWIDPAVSAYLAGALKGNVKAEHSPSLQSTAPKTRPLNPPTPIPPRASAQHPNAVKVRPKYSRTHTQPIQEEEDLSRIPTLPPPTMWQYESSQFEAESSLSSLSLVIETPTQPQPISARSLLELPLSVDQPAIQSPKSGKHITDIDEIDTLPEQPTQLSPSPMPAQLSPATSRTVDIDEIDTQPHKPTHYTQHIIDIDEIDTLSPRIVASVAPASSTSLVPTHPVQSPTHVRLTMSPTATSNMLAASAPTERVVSMVEPSSWTAGGMRESAYARRIVDRSKGRKHRPTTPTMHSLDLVRWWLLHPGRLEGLLWLGGTLLLLSVTFALLIVSAISLSWISPRTQSDIASSLTTTAGMPTRIPTVITSHGLTLILENAQVLVPGQPIQLRGRGFSPRGQITFTDEKNQPLLIQATQTNTVESDPHGMFAVTLSTSTWAAGTHHIFVRDGITGRIANISITLDAGPFGKKATATVPPGVTPTVPPGQGGVFPTPVNSTPAPITPTASSSTPTPVTGRPTATPTIGVTPTNTPIATPTVGTTPSPSSSPGTRGQSNSTIGTAGVTSLGNDSTLSLFGWLLIAGYSLAMLLLGLTALLRKRQS